MASVFPPSTYATCSTCSARCVATITHEVKIGPSSPRGPSRVASWSSCAKCDAADQIRWQEQRADEERERLQAKERQAKAEQRDRDRQQERQREQQRKQATP